MIMRSKSPYHPDRFDNAQILCNEGLTGRYYWEVVFDFGSDGGVGVAYKSITRVGDCSPEYSFGNNEKSWYWSIDGTFYHNGSIESFLGSRTTSLGVYLDWPAGILSFFEVSPDEVTHLYTVRTTFTEPLYPAFGLYHGSMYINKIKME